MSWNTVEIELVSAKKKSQVLLWWLPLLTLWLDLHDKLNTWATSCLWPCPRPFPSVRPCKANIYQHLTHMVVQVPGISAGNDQRTTGLICPTLQYSSHDTWLTRKFKISVWVESELEAWEVRWATSVLSHELEHSRNRNRKCRKSQVLLWWLPSLTSRLDLHDEIYMYMYLCNKLFYGHVPELFPWCRIHTRLGWYMKGLYTSYAPKALTEFGWSRESQLKAVCMGDTMHRTYTQSKRS